MNKKIWIYVTGLIVVTIALALIAINTKAQAWHDNNHPICHEDHKGKCIIPTPTEEIVISCTPTPELSISPSGSPSATPQDTPTPTVETRIESPASANNVEQSKTEDTPTPSEKYIGPTLYPEVGWK
jgi:hypothetical protein